jgi:hypothetical protein
MRKKRRKTMADKFLGLDWEVKIAKPLIVDPVVYQFADPQIPEACGGNPTMAYRCGNPAAKPHLCPFKVEMEDDPEKKALTPKCNCCETCEGECREAI